MKYFKPITASTFLALCFWTTVATAQPLRFEHNDRASEWDIYYGTNKVLVYAFDPVKFKPYVKELWTLSGYNVLRDAPSDHLHHHGLMYAIRVNGLNFWEETPGNGVQKTVQSWPPQLVLSADGKPQARLTQVLHWLKPDDAFLPDTSAAALLIEHRTLTVTIDAQAKEVSLQWQAEFEVGGRTNQVRLTGSNYNGLGLRFRAALDSLALHNVGGKIVNVSNSRQDLTQAPWAAITFDQADNPVTLAIAGDHSNRRSDPVFFSMKTPFAYLSATQGLDREPLVYERGEKFTLRYLYPEVKSTDFLDQRVKRWD